LPVNVNRKMRCINSLLMVFALAALACCNNSSAKRTHAATATRSSPSLPAQRPVPTAAIFSNDTLPGNKKATGYGYNIYLNGKLYIHQPLLPATIGNTGFSTAEKAATTARLVIYKIEHNIIPPGVSVRELDSLGVR
jgi:Domain of unknown function (DUF4907)